MGFRQKVLPVTLVTLVLAAQPRLAKGNIDSKPNLVAQRISVYKAQQKLRGLEDIFEGADPKYDTYAFSLLDQKNAEDVSQYGDLAIDYCIKYLQNGNSSQRKVAARALMRIRNRHHDIDRAIPIIVNTWLSDSHSYVRADARNTIESFDFNQLFHLIVDTKLVVRIKGIECLAKKYTYCKQFNTRWYTKYKNLDFEFRLPGDKDNRSYNCIQELLDELMIDKEEDYRVRSVAIVYGNSELSIRFMDFIYDPNENPELRKLLLANIGNYVRRDMKNRKKGQLYIDRYEKMRSDLKGLIRDEENKKLYGSVVDVALVGVNSELSFFYFYRARMDFNEKKDDEAKKDLYQAMVLMSELPPRYRHRNLQRGIVDSLELGMSAGTGYMGTDEFEHIGGIWPYETLSAFKELVASEENIAIADCLKQSIISIEKTIQKYPTITEFRRWYKTLK